MKLGRLVRRALRSHSLGDYSPEQFLHQAAQSTRLVARLDDAGFVSIAYQLILGRAVDPHGFEAYVGRLSRGEITRQQFVTSMVESTEFKARSVPSLSDVVHASRLELVRQLPRAATIVDLGGTCIGRPEGALIVMGYPYPFQSLQILELPPERRHPRYADQKNWYGGTIRTSLGPVGYVYTSMVDLSSFADASVDLVYSGQSIEHVTREEAQVVFKEVHRILKPQGYFCLDTPNRAVTRLHSPDDYVDADHKYEYTHPEMSSMLQRTEFAIEDAKGLCLARESLAAGRFLEEELRRRPGLYDDIESSYLLYYRCRRA
jgi:predicted SAM-dependent methyltransferase